MKLALSCGAACLWAALSSTAFAQNGAYHYVYRPVQVPQEVTAYKVEYETVYKPEVRTSYRQVVETVEQERRYHVQKPFYETAEQEHNEITYEPQTTFVMRQEDRGGWEAQTVVQPGAVSHHLAWRPGGYVFDPGTGMWYWQLGGFGWVATQGPAVAQTQHVWRPNIVCAPVPQTSYVQKVVTRKIPVQVLKYRTEEVVQKVPVQVCKSVAVQETVQVAHVQQKLIPVKYTQWVQKLELLKVPVDPCTCRPLAIGTLAPTATSTLASPSLPAGQVEAGRREVPPAKSPTEAAAKNGESGEKSVMKDLKTAPAEKPMPAEKTAPPEKAASKEGAEKPAGEWKPREKEEGDILDLLNGPKTGDAAAKPAAKPAEKPAE